MKFQSSFQWRLMRESRVMPELKRWWQSIAAFVSVEANAAKPRYAGAKTLVAIHQRYAAATIRINRP